MPLWKPFFVNMQSPDMLVLVDLSMCKCVCQLYRKYRRHNTLWGWGAWGGAVETENVLERNTK